MLRRRAAGGTSVRNREPIRIERIPEPDRGLCLSLRELMRTVWSMSDIDLLPPWKIFVTPRTGGELLVVYADGEIDGPVGFALLSYATDGRRPFLYMDMIGVLERLRNLSVAERMIDFASKLADERGVPSIQWTYDPLQGANANLYIRKCGAVGTRFYHDYYGELSGAAHGGTTDRLLVKLERGPRPATSASYAGRCTLSSLEAEYIPA